MGIHLLICLDVASASGARSVGKLSLGGGDWNGRGKGDEDSKEDGEARHVEDSKECCE